MKESTRISASNPFGFGFEIGVDVTIFGPAMEPGCSFLASTGFGPGMCRCRGSPSLVSSRGPFISGTKQFVSLRTYEKLQQIWLEY